MGQLTGPTSIAITVEISSNGLPCGSSYNPLLSTLRVNLSKNCIIFVYGINSAPSVYS